MENRYFYQGRRSLTFYGMNHKLNYKFCYMLQTR